MGHRGHLLPPPLALQPRRPRPRLRRTTSMRASSPSSNLGPFVPCSSLRVHPGPGRPTPAPNPSYPDTPTAETDGRMYRKRCPGCLSHRAVFPRLSPAGVDEAAQATWTGEGYEKEEARGASSAYIKFQKRLGRKPEQCARYAFGGSLVWPCKARPK